LFVATCVLPTLSTLAWAAYRLSPLHAAAEKTAWEKWFFDRSGLIARIGQVEHPGGGSTLLVGVTLSDSDGGQRIAKLRQAEFARTPQGIVVLLSQPEVEHGKLLRVWESLHDRVLRGPPLDAPIQISAGELTLELGRRAQTFTLLRCTFEPQQAGVGALLEFQLAGRQIPVPASLRLERSSQNSPPSTRWHLSTPSAIPCQLFSEYLPGLANLGNDCEFQGTIGAVESSGVWSAELSGRFSHVDLESATQLFPHRLSGLATVNLEQAVVVQGTITSAAGEITSGGGAVSTSLLASLAEHLRVAVPPATLQAPQPHLIYSELACQFAIDSAGITLAGRCVNGRAGTVFHGTAGPLLVADAQATIPLVSLVRALSPESSWLVPATNESKHLLGILALPSGNPSKVAVAQQPRARLRLQTPSSAKEVSPPYDPRIGRGPPGGSSGRERRDAILPATHLDPG
jgi:hypothetical protein